jgi:hypothetical protein
MLEEFPRRKNRRRGYDLDILRSTDAVHRWNLINRRFK